MVRFQLMPEKTVRDFELMAVASITIFVAFLTWIVGAVIDMALMMWRAYL